MPAAADVPLLFAAVRSAALDLLRARTRRERRDTQAAGTKVTLKVLRGGRERRQTDRHAAGGCAGACSGAMSMSGNDWRICEPLPASLQPASR